MRRLHVRRDLAVVHLSRRLSVLNVLDLLRLQRASGMLLERRLPLLKRRLRRWRWSIHHQRTPVRRRSIARAGSSARRDRRSRSMCIPFRWRISLRTPRSGGHRLWRRMRATLRRRRVATGRIRRRIVGPVLPDIAWARGRRIVGVPVLRVSVLVSVRRYVATSGCRAGWRRVVRVVPVARAWRRRIRRAVCIRGPETLGRRMCSWRTRSHSPSVRRDLRMRNHFCSRSRVGIHPHHLP